MKTYGLTFSIILVFAGFALGQATTANCPTVQVIGPEKVIPVGQAIPFSAKVGGINSALTFNWTVSNGSIESGQGTPNIVVLSDEDGITVKAEVSVAGLPDQCPNKAVEFAAVAENIIGCSSDEFSDLKPNEIRAKMDIFFAELSNNPDDTGLVIFHITSKEKQTPDNPRIQLIVKHARFREFDLSRIVFAIETMNSESPRTVLYRVPKGAESPCPGCITFPGNSIQ